MEWLVKLLGHRESNAQSKTTGRTNKRNSDSKQISYKEKDTDSASESSEISLPSKHPRRSTRTSKTTPRSTPTRRTTKRKANQDSSSPKDVTLINKKTPTPQTKRRTLTPPNKSPDILDRSHSSRLRHQAVPNYQLIFEQEIETTSEQSYDPMGDLFPTPKSPNRTARTKLSPDTSKSPNIKRSSNFIASDSSEDSRSSITSIPKKFISTKRKRSFISYKEKSDSSSESGDIPSANEYSHNTRAKRTNFIRSTSVDSSVVAPAERNGKRKKLTVSESDTDDYLSDCCFDDNGKETFLSSEGESYKDSDIETVSISSGSTCSLVIAKRTTRSTKIDTDTDINTRSRARLCATPSISRSFADESNKTKPIVIDKYEILKKKYKIKKCSVRLIRINADELKAKGKPNKKAVAKKAQKEQPPRIEKEFKCIICQSVFQDKKLYQNHTNKLRLSCCKCFRKFDNRSKLEKHHDLHIVIMLKCDFCGQSFKSTDSLKVHKLTHSGLQLKI